MNNLFLKLGTQVQYIRFQDLNEKHYGGTLVNYRDECYVIGGFNSNTVERSHLRDLNASWVKAGSTAQKRWQAGSVLCGGNVNLMRTPNLRKRHHTL